MPLFINDVVYAELSVRYEWIEELDAFVDQAGLRFSPFPRAALFVAGKVFTRYRRGGGTRNGMLWKAPRSRIWMPRKLGDRLD